MKLAGSEDGQESSEAGAPDSVEARIAELDEHIANAQSHLENGDHEAARVELEEYETEVDALAQELANVATDDDARAEALAALLEEALSRHTEVLTQLAVQVPAGAQASIQKALDSSAAGREAVNALFGNGMPGGPPGDIPGGGYGE